MTVNSRSVAIRELCTALCDNCPAIGCVTTFTAPVGGFIVGGFIEHITDVALGDCRRACAKLVTCAAFHYSSSTAQCGLKKHGADSNTLTTKESFHREYQAFNKVSCTTTMIVAPAASTTLATATTVTTASAAPTGTTGNFLAAYNEPVEGVKGAHKGGKGKYLNMVSVASAEGCAALCSSAAHVLGCEGFSFEIPLFNKGRCQMHSAIGVATTYSNSKTIAWVFYKKSEDAPTTAALGGCSPTYSTPVMGFIAGGNLMQFDGVQSIQACQDKCTDQEACAAFHYNKNQKCGLKTHKADSSTLKTARDFHKTYEAFNKVAAPCTTTLPPATTTDGKLCGVPTYSAPVVGFIRGGALLLIKGVAAAQSCQDACTQKKECAAFHFAAQLNICGLKSHKANSGTLASRSNYQQKFQAYNKVAEHIEGC